MAEVTPGIHQIQLPLPDRSLGHVNVYLAIGRQCLLIDTGWPSEAAFNLLQKELTIIGVRLGDISQVVITHAHVDHFGLANRLKQFSNAKIIYHSMEGKFIESRFIHRNVYPTMISNFLKVNGLQVKDVSQGLNALMERGKYVQPVLADLTLHDNETISTGLFQFQSLWTPGHTGGHVCLYEPNMKVLIAGDHILPTITPVIGLHPGTERSCLGDYLESLERVRQLKVNLVLPGHGQPFIDLQQRVGQLVKHHRARESEILQAVEKRGKTACQIAAEIYWKVGGTPVGFHKLTASDCILAVLETISHLEFMGLSNKVTKFSQCGEICYSTAASVDIR